MSLGRGEAKPTTWIFTSKAWFRPRYDFKGDPQIFCRSFTTCERISRQPQHFWAGMPSGNRYKAQTRSWDFTRFPPDMGTACSSLFGCFCSSTHQLQTGEMEQVSPCCEMPFSSSPFKSLLCPQFPAQEFSPWAFCEDRP